jgi:hypothetical protein
MARVTREVRYSRWAVELARAAHAAFVHTAPDGGRRMYWKMRTDLSGPLVPSQGQHDALDAYVTYLQLSATAATFGERAGLTEQITEAGEMAEAMPLATDDPLGIGGLLSDASRTARLSAEGLPLSGMTGALLRAAVAGLERWSRSEPFALPAARRLAFRELGLGIGLRAVASLSEEVRPEAAGEAERYLPLAEMLETYWLDAKHQAVPSWREHEDINGVMLATSLLPGGFVDITEGRS